MSDQGAMMVLVHFFLLYTDANWRLLNFLLRVIQTVFELMFCIVGDFWEDTCVLFVKLLYYHLYVYLCCQLMDSLVSLMRCFKNWCHFCIFQKSLISQNGMRLLPAVFVCLFFLLFYILFAHWFSALWEWFSYNYWWIYGSAIGRAQLWINNNL